MGQSRISARNQLGWLEQSFFEERKLEAAEEMDYNETFMLAVLS